ncbi:MAG: hypothetical protein AAB804_03090 [Patescibacteria group bacterium]
MDPSEHDKEKIERLRRAMYSRSLSPKLHDRERRTLEQPDMHVGEDFVEPKEELPNVTVAPRLIGLTRAALWWLLGAAIVFFVGAVSFFAYYFLMGGGGLAAAPGNIGISVAGPPQIEGGAPTEFQIVVANRNKVSLELADLIITYPDGTRSPTDFSTDLPSQRISLGSIEPGGTRQGTVSAVLAGDEGEHSNVKVELEYRIQGSSAIFVTSTDYEVIFSSSPISLVVEGNKEAVSGQPVEIRVTVASNANAPVRDVLLSAQYPFGFKFTSSVPEASGKGLWQIGDLSPGQKRTVTIRGTLAGEQGDERVFQFKAGTRRSESADTIETSLTQNAFPIAISKPFLGLAVSVGGATGSSVTVSPGENVAVTIAWQNNLSTAITDAVIVAKLSGIVIDGTTLHTVDGFYRSSDNIMLWDKTTSGGKLANLTPGARGTVGFSFQMPKGVTLEGTVNPVLNISINAAGKRISESGVPENLQASASQKIALASELGFTAQGLYYANPFGSVGPMPPKAGSETTYAIVFTVTNTTNKVSDARVTAHLPPYVRWVGIYSPSSETIIFNQNDGTVTWDLGVVEAGAGLNGSSPRQAAIAIGLTPSTSQIGQEPPLIQNISLTGIDEATKAPITRAVKNVTTNIQGDPGFSSANATVVK